MLARKSGKLVTTKEEKEIDLTAVSPKIAEFFKRVKKVCPKIKVDEHTNWEKEIHNYKHAIYIETVVDYGNAWHFRDFGFSAMVVKVVDNALKVTFTKEFLEDLEKFYKDV